MKVNIFNTAPRFTRNLVSKRVRFNSIGTYLLPETVDDEDNPVRIINKNLPNFINFVADKGLYEFYPTNPKTDLGPHVIRVELTDSHMSSEFVFSLYVFNEPPFFDAPLRDQRVFLFNEFLYFLPMITDSQDLPVKFSVSLADNSRIPDFIKFTRETVTAYSVN